MRGGVNAYADHVPLSIYSLGLEILRIGNSELISTEYKLKWATLILFNARQQLTERL